MLLILGVVANIGSGAGLHQQIAPGEVLSNAAMVELVRLYSDLTGGWSSCAVYGLRHPRPYDQLTAQSGLRTGSTSAA
jgi:hypothetical protein